MRLETVGFAALGVAADLDLLVGSHRGPTHSLGAILFVAVVAWLAAGRRPRRGRWAISCAAAFGSHLLLDWLGSDTSAPFGVPALWPFLSTYYQAPWPIFLAVSRRIHQPDLFWIPNALAVGRELLILVPIVVLVGSWRRSRRKGMRNGAIAATVAVLGAAVGAEHLSARQPAPDRRSPYVEAVETYLGGRFDDALTALKRLPQADIRNQERDLKKDPRMIQAAAMLHTEAMQSEFLDDPMARFHFSTARRLISELRRVQPAGEFQRGWYLLASAILQGSKSVNGAEELLEEARSVFPHDADLLVSTAAAFEIDSVAPSGLGPDQHFAIAARMIDADVLVKYALQSATRYLNEAVTLDPGLDEAHLRLGRVLHRLGQLDRAASELAVVRRHTQDDSFRYLAVLFEASLESASGRPERAMKLYREALDILAAQSALVGLSHSYYELGRGDDAALALQNVFHLPPEQPDPWFAYIAGDAWHTSMRLKAMRALVAGGPGALQ